MELLSLLNELKQMKWIDLSHEFGENTPRWLNVIFAVRAFILVTT